MMINKKPSDFFTEIRRLGFCWILPLHCLYRFCILWSKVGLRSCVFEAIYLKKCLRLYVFWIQLSPEASLWGCESVLRICSYFIPNVHCLPTSYPCFSYIFLFLFRSYPPKWVKKWVQTHIPILSQLPSWFWSCPPNLQSFPAFSLWLLRCRYSSS